MPNNEDEVPQEVMSEMAFDERLLWAGRPVRGRLSALTVPITVFGILWVLFGCFWMAGAAVVGSVISGLTGVPNIMPLIGAPIILIGIGIIASPRWLVRKASSTVYAVSDQRILIITVGSTRTVESYSRRELGEIIRRERPDGSGDLVFSQPRLISSAVGTVQTVGAAIGFFGIPDVRKVEQLVRGPSAEMT